MANPSLEGEDMLFALLGGQVDSKAVSATQAHRVFQPIARDAVLETPIIANTIPEAAPERLSEPFPSAEWRLSPNSSTEMRFDIPTAVSSTTVFAEAARGVEDLNPEELWGRLQTFYEPTAGMWGANPGYVDYMSGLGSIGMS